MAIYGCAGFLLHNYELDGRNSDEMRSAILLLAVAFCVRCQTQLGPSNNDEHDIRSMLAEYEAAWNQHRPELTQRFFAEDAEVTNVVGLTKRGRAGASEFSQNPLFQKMYSAAHEHFDDVSVRFLTRDIAAVDVRWTMLNARHPDGTPWDDRRGLLNLIVTREHGSWLIKLFHNAEFPARPKSPAPSNSP